MATANHLVIDTSDAFCNSADGPCTKVKRAAEAIAQLAKVEEDGGEDEKPKDEKRWGRYHAHCYRVGEPCYKRKRALEDLAAAVAKI